ncbi:MAG: hypothetical protein HY228_01075 [Candidatus Yonathbacteria bacterium]|nr:hypothetical protein [Candidatus Yonathbacteria bacterium]
MEKSDKKSGGFASPSRLGEYDKHLLVEEIPPQDDSLLQVVKRREERRRILKGKEDKKGVPK